MTVQEHTVATHAPKRSRAPIEVYDFRRPTTLAREHARVLDLAFETFARQWGTQLTAKVREMCQVTSERVSMQTYNEYAASLPPTTAMVLCELEGISAKGVIQFQVPAALTLVSYMLGGNGASVPDKADRKFTPIEQALVGRLMDDALEDLRYSLDTVLVNAIRIDTIQYNSQFAQAAAPSDLMIVAEFTIRVAESNSPATLALPGGALLPQLGEAQPVSSTRLGPELIKEHVASSPVDVSLQLAPMAVKPSRILDLAVGDVLSIPHPQHRPLHLSVDGRPVARAAVGANGSRLACIVVNPEEEL